MHTHIHLFFLSFFPDFLMMHLSNWKGSLCFTGLLNPGPLFRICVSSGPLRSVCSLVLYLPLDEYALFPKNSTHLSLLVPGILSTASLIGLLGFAVCHQ